MALPEDARAATAPRGETAARYLEAAQARRLETRAEYVSDLGSLTLTGDTRRIEPVRRREPGVKLEGGTGTIIVVVVLLALLLLFLRFGGTGTILSRTPKDKDGKTIDAPESWKIDADEAATDQQSLLAQLRAMPDRRAALVRLLRHVLLAAGTACETRFARSDTEREAFARLPGDWKYRGTLADILKAAELAHYGGREVSDDGFEQALSQGATILRLGEMRHG